MHPERGAVAVETLLKVVLVLAAVWLVIEIVGAVFGLLGDLIRLVQPVLVAAILVLVLLWLLDRL